MFKFKTDPLHRGKRGGKLVNPTRFKRFVNAFTSWVLFITVTVWSIGAPLTVLFAPATALAAVSTTLVISELKVTGGETANDDEFVEIYNKTGSAIDLAGWDIAYEAPTATGGTHTWVAAVEIDANNHVSIPAYGFFLFASNGYNPNGIYADINGTGAMGLASAGGFVALRNATDVVIDFVGYGTVTTAALCEGGAAAQNPGNFSIERKAAVSSSALTMGFGGTDQWSGNGYDSVVNSADFVLKTFTEPQKSTFPSESSSFMITNVMPMGPQTISLMFNKQINPTTVSTAVATLHTGAADTETITSITVRNGNELEIYAAGANINGMTGSDTITISDVVKDMGGNANISTSAKTIQFFMPPEVQGVQYVDANTIKINFTKAMDEASAETAAAWTIYVDGATANMTGATYTLNTSGDSKILTIAKASAFNATGGNDYVKPVYDGTSAPRDAQGNNLMPSFGWQREFYFDGTKPYIVSGRSDATTATLKFSEELSSGPNSPTETSTNYTFAGTTGACAGTKSVRFYQPTDGPMAMDTVVITCSGGVTLATNDTITVSTNVTDKAGLAMDTTAGKNVFTKSATSNTAIKISSVTGNPANGSYNMQMDGCMDSWGMTGLYQGAAEPNDCDENSDTGHRDSLVVKFNGPIDPASINYDTANSKVYNVGTFLEMYEKQTRTAASSAACQAWETWNGSNACTQKMMGNFGSSFGVLSQTTVANDTLTIYLQGRDVNIIPGMEIKPTGIRGLNGLTAEQSDTAENNRFTMTFAEVRFVKVALASAPTFAASDTVTLFFSGDMARGDIASFADATAKLKPAQNMPFYQEHNWGTTGGAIAWGNHDGAVCTTGGTETDGTPDCLKITLGATPTVKNKDDIMAMNLKDRNGMYLGWGGKIDATVLALNSYTWNSTSHILILEFNKMLKDYNTDGEPNFTNNTITPTGVSITAKEPVFDTGGSAGGSGGMGMQMFKKIKLTLNEAIANTDSFNFSGSAIVDENGNIVPNITVVTANPATNQVAPTIDDKPPVVRKIRTNDWNSDGTLNGGDEIIFFFDNEAVDTNGANVSDVDYTTIDSTKLKADLVLKRGSTAVAGADCSTGTVVTNGFGDWINYWVDMWEEHAGEFHVNLGMGANIQAGDRICSSASPNLKDSAGNALAGNKVLAVVSESRNAEITKVIYSDVDTSGTLTHNDTFTVQFSSEINPATLGSYTSGGTPEVTNIQWGLGIEFNWEAGNMGAYNPSTMKTWGTSTTGDWNAGFTALTISLDCNNDGDAACDTADGSEAQMADFDMIKPYSVQTAEGAWVNKPKFIDLTAPTLTQVLGDKVGANFILGDMLTFLFSEPMDDATITEGTIATLQTELGISDGKSFGTDSVASWADPEKKALKVTLGAGTTVASDTTFNPTSAVKDKNGNADATAGTVAITTQTVRPASNVVLADLDTTYPGIDGRDVKITWTAPTGYDSTYTYDLYVLPDFVPFNPDANGTYVSGETTHFPIATASQSVSCASAVCSYTANSYVMTDSRAAINKATGAMQTGAPFFPLSDWEKYTAFVVAIDGSAHRSFPQRYGSSLYLTMEYGGAMDNKAPWVEGTMPFDGAIVPINNRKLNVKFSEPMARTTVEATGNIKIQQCSTDCQLEARWSTISQIVSISYNDTNNEAKIDLAADLTANTKYRIFVSGTAVTDKSALPLGNNFTSRFKTSSASDTTAPKVAGNSFQYENVGTIGANGAITGVPRTKPMVGIAFDKDMDPSSFTTTSVTLTPSVSGSTSSYDPMMKGMAYFFGGPLAKATTYTLTLSGVYIKDAAGNTLDGDQSGSASGSTSDNYTLTFTSAGGDLSATQPTITWIMSDGHHIDVGFSADINKNAATNKANWALTQGSTMVNLQISNFDYDPFMKELHIGPIEISPNVSHTLTPSSSVLGMNGATIATSTSNLAFTPKSKDATFTGGSFGAGMYQTGGMFGSGGMFDSTNMTNFDNMMKDTATAGASYNGVFDPMMAGKMYMDNAYMDNDIKTFMPIDAWPMNQVEGKTTNYHIGFPTAKSIPHGGKIVLQFPSGFDVTNTAMATDEFMTGTPLFFFNQDINGPGGTSNEISKFNPAGRVQVSAITANNMDKTITLTLAVEDAAGCVLNANGTFGALCTNSSSSDAGKNSTMPFDYINFELSGIKNGSSSEIDWQSGAGGYQISITTKDNLNKVLEGGSSNPIKSMKFPIKAAGAGSISGKVTAQDGVTGIADAMVFVDSPMSGPIDMKTGADGTYSVSGLPVATGSNTYEGWYHIRVESPKNNDTYFGGAGFDVQLSQSSPTVTGKNARLQTAANTLTVKLTTGGIIDNVMVWVGGPNGQNEKKFTLDSTDDDGALAGIQNNLEIKISDGEWDVGVHPFFSEAKFMMGPPPPPSFMPPVPKKITASGNTNVSISLTSAAYEITGAVKNADTGKGLSNVNVHAFSAFGGQMPSDTQTRTDGSFTLKVSPGTYKIEAFMPGLPPAPPQTVEVTNASVSGVEINMYKPSKTISGKVTDGTNGIRDAGVNARNDKGQFIFKNTDTNGEYVLYVDASASWSVEVFAPGFGKLSPATGVTATNINTTSADVTGINFTISNSHIVAISGMVKDANNNGVAGVQVWADQVSYVGETEGAMTGVGNGATTDANGSYTINVSASTAGTGAGATRYKISGRDPNTGDLTPITGIDASSSVTGKNLTISTSRTITIDIQNAPSNSLLNPADTTGYFMDKAMLDIYSPTANKGNNKKIEDTDLSDASDGTISIPEGSGYRAHLQIPGYGEFTATENGATGFAISGGNSTIHFDLKRQGTAIVPITLSGTVTASSANVANAYVSAINETTYEVIGEMTNNSGAYSLKVPDLNPDGTDAKYKIRVDKPNYSSPTSFSAVTADKSNANFQLTSNTSAISGTVCENSSCSTVAKSAEVMAQEVGGEGFKRTTSNADTGTFSLALAPNKVWNITAKSKIGGMGQKLNIASGATGLQVILTNQINAATQGIISSTVKNQQIKPADGGVVNDIDNTGVKLTIPAEALGNSDSYVPINIQEIASVPETSDFKPLGGIGKEITSTASVEKDINLEFAFSKTETEAITETTSTHNALAQLNQVQNVYWDDNANNYVPLSTTKTVEIKASSTAETWTPITWSAFLDNVDNTDGDGRYNYYVDYKITLKSTTDHFTIFGLKTGADSTPPSAPAGLAATAGNARATLLWTANTEADLMEYEIYRKTTAGVTVVNANQVNASQVATNSYIDTTVSNWTSYYYIITASDSSQNESSASAEVRVCPNPGVSKGIVNGATCVITCNSGYTLNNDAHTCTAAGGGVNIIRTNNTETVKEVKETTEIKTKTTAETIKTIPAKAKEFADKIVTIVSEAVEIIKANVNSFLAKLGVKRDLAKEVLGVGKYVKSLIKDVATTKDQENALTNFITYGTNTTLSLGEGERAGVVNSYKSAFGKLPGAETEWSDTIKIANGRWTSEISEKAEANAVESFKKIYLREPDRTNPRDDAAVVVMAYGLRPANRNMESEKAAIKIFEGIYKYSPTSAVDWDAVRAIAYSGATR